MIPNAARLSIETSLQAAAPNIDTRRMGLNFGGSLMMSSSAGSVRRPPRYAWKRNPIFKFLASLRLAVILLGVLIVMSIVGTIAESKFDADTARLWIYEAPWFSLWIALLVANLACSTLMRWPWRKHHTGFLLTHLGIIVVVLGAVIGQTGGIEGTMTLFRDAPPDDMLVLQTRQLTIRDGGSQQAMGIHLGRRTLEVRGKPMDLWVTPSGWKIEAVASSSRLLSTFQPAPAAEGSPAVRVRLRTGAMNQTVDQWLLAGHRDHSRLDLGLITVDLIPDSAEPPTTGAGSHAIIRVKADGTFGIILSTRGKHSAETPLTVGKPMPTGWADWTIEAVQNLPSATPAFHFEPLPENQTPPMGQPLLEGVKIRASNGDRFAEQWVAAGWRANFPTGSFPLEVAYGWETHRLPFGLVLRNFAVEHNEGTDDPASFRSDLSVILPDGVEAASGSCAMNRPFDYPSAWWRSLTGLTYKISQASWNPNDPTQSSVQILRDPGWLFKWVGSLIICSGLIAMFIFRRPTGRAVLPTANNP